MYTLLILWMLNGKSLVFHLELWFVDFSDKKTARVDPPRTLQFTMILALIPRSWTGLWFEISASLWYFGYISLWVTVTKMLQRTHLLGLKIINSDLFTCWRFCWSFSICKAPKSLYKLLCSYATPMFSAADVLLYEQYLKHGSPAWVTV